MCSYRIINTVRIVERIRNKIAVLEISPFSRESTRCKREQQQQQPDWAAEHFRATFSCPLFAFVVDAGVAFVYINL